MPEQVPIGSSQAADESGGAGADIGALLSPDSSVMQGLAGIQTQKTAETESSTRQIERQLGQDQAHVARMQAASEATGVEMLKYPEWNADRRYAEYHREPLEAFGSLGSVFGIIASAFTHAPMENALNASAAAMNAIKKGDDEAYERAQKSWKDNMALVQKRHEMMREGYADAVTLLKTNLAAGQAKLEMLTARYGDKKAQFLLENGLSEEFFKLLDSRNKAMEGAVQAVDTVTKSQMQKKFFQAELERIDGVYQNPYAQAAQGLAAFNRIYGVKETTEQQAVGAMIAEKMGKGEPVTAEDYIKVHERMYRPLRQTSDQMLYDMLQNDLGRPPTADEFAEAKRNYTGVTQRVEAQKETTESRERIATAQATERERHQRRIEEIQAGRGDVAKQMADERERHDKEMEKIQATGRGAATSLTIQRQNAAAADNYAKKLREDNPTMDEDEIQKKRAEHYRDLQTQSTALSGNRIAQARSRINQIEYSLTDIDEAERLLAKHTGISGFGGKFTRPLETLSTIFGSNEDDRHKFETIISTLQERAPRILLDSQGRPLAAENSRIEKVIRGLNLGDTGPIAAKNLQFYRKELQRMKADTEHLIQSGPQTAPPAPSSTTPTPGGGRPAWESAPLVTPDKRSAIDSEDEQAA